MFRYFNMWSLTKYYKEKVGRSWEKNILGTCIYQMVGKLHRLQRVLKDLNKNRFADVKNKATEMMQKLKNYQAMIKKDPKNGSLIEEKVKLVPNGNKLET